MTFIAKIGWRRLIVNPGRAAPIEGFELLQVDALDVAADAALGEAERHPWLEVLYDSRLHFGVFEEVVVEAIGKGVHQRLQPCRAGRVLGLQLGGIDEDLHAKVLIDA